MRFLEGFPTERRDSKVALGTFHQDRARLPASALVLTGPGIHCDMHHIDWVSR
ncbi:hypothetical protein [Streptomyces tubercidicus]|uniref:hypothetical protein n=1 Tax=Streptomyces tubercidicus TaxID=47759 RepID=UPI003466D928